MTDLYGLPPASARRLARAILLTRAGLAAERAVRAFWPLWTVLLLALSAPAFGAHEALPLPWLWGSLAAVAILALGTLARGLMRFRWPSQAEAILRLDASLPGRPLATLADSPAVGGSDAASVAVWRAHLARMAERAGRARPVDPDLRLSSRDRHGLRYVALTAFAAALLFGSLWRVGTVADAVTLGPNAALASGPAWEGWIEPPSYTGRPSLYLADIGDGPLGVPVGSRVTLRLYGEVGALAVTETVSGATGLEEGADPAAPTRDFAVLRDGTITVEGPGGRNWQLDAQADLAPEISVTGESERTASGEMRRPFIARDDYGVVAGRAEIALDLAAVDRRHGLGPDPEPRDPIVLDLPMTITGDRTDFTEVLIEDLSRHPFANLPVTITLHAEDAAGQTGSSLPERMVLPGRRFFDPLAAAVIELRRDLLWTRDALPRVTQLLRAVTWQPDDVFRDRGAYLQLRVALRRMEAAANAGGLTPEARDELAEALWEIAERIEEGDLNSALERLRRAQDRLSEAMRNGASDDEIASLMQELREAMDDYMRQLAQNAQPQDQQSAENMQEVSPDMLEQMMEEIQRLMEEGRMAEAQALLDQLMQMMQNMQVTQGEGGEGQQSPGQQAMEGLAETLREQQGLSDESFGELQERFGEGQQGQQGEGQQDQQQGQEGQGQQQGMGEGRDQGQRQGEGDGGDQRSLADRQRDLRRELDRQAQNLPGAGTEEGDSARENLDRAGRAMDRAEESLRNDDLAGALDDQAEALEALREGMRDLAEQMAQEQQQGQGQQGQELGQGDPSGQRDPLGRDMGNSGRIGTDENVLGSEDPRRRAQDLMDEIRRRSGDQSRPEPERDYLERLLDRF